MKESCYFKYNAALFIMLISLLFYYPRSDAGRIVNLINSSQDVMHINSNYIFAECPFCRSAGAL